MRLQRIRRYFIVFLIAGAILVSGIIVYANAVILTYPSIVYQEISQVPTTTLTLVLGGGMTSPGVMSDMQTDRVLEAVALYKAHKTEKLFMSGDDGAFRDDEVTFMKERAVQEGVPPKDISIDPHAYRTYLSCYHAKQQYGIEKMLIITQNFHLPRALYFCNEMGVRTVGVSANLRESYRGMWKIQIREVLARVKAVWQMKISKPGK